VTVTAVGGRDVVVVVQRTAHTGRHRFLTHVEMEEAGQAIRFGQTPGGLFEQADAHHASVQIELHEIELHVYG
jgi:hypothetical protein